jgi:beta-N-acetylhexosaminidase
MSELTTAQVRQTLLLGFVGTNVTTVAPLVRRLRPAGLIILPRNVESAGQLAELTSGLQAVARDEGLPPLLFAVDQEGGAVARLSATAGFTDLPAAMSVGLAADPELARGLAVMTGRELAAVGINLDFAPVLDLAIDPANTVIGSRSFGGDPAAVADLGAAVIDGLQSAGILACAKHFPGHGATAIDSHLDLPRLDATRRQLEERDLVPFQAAIATGCAAIMTAHVLSAFDPDRPATLSTLTLRDVLRDRLGFDGLILTDALEMRALALTGLQPWQTGAAALRAGADLLVFEGDLELIERTVASLDDALDRGGLDPGAFEASARRLAAARARLSPAGPPLACVGSADHWELARRATSRGLAGGGTRGTARSPAGAPPTVLDTPLGREFAAACAWRVGWPVESPGASRTEEAVVAVIADDDLPADLGTGLSRLAANGSNVLLVVLGGWRVPARVPAGVTVVMAHDLPRGLWPVLAEHLVGHPDAGPASIEPAGR